MVFFMGKNQNYRAATIVPAPLQDRRTGKEPIMRTRTLSYPCTRRCNGRKASGADLRIKAQHPLLRAAIFVIWGFVFTLLAAPDWGLAATIPSQADRFAIEKKWGVQIVGIRQTAAGHMLDFRYRVVDSQKAAPLFVRQIQPYLIDQASGKSLIVPNMAKVGPLRSSNQPQQGRTYWMFFGNPGLVKAGDKVSVVIGDFKVENLTVE
jgi:hypothetical protein